MSRRLDPSWIVIESIENPSTTVAWTCSLARMGASDLRSSAAMQRTLERGRRSATSPDCAMPRNAEPWPRRRGGSRGSRCEIHDIRSCPLSIAGTFVLRREGYNPWRNARPAENCLLPNEARLHAPHLGGTITGAPPAAQAAPVQPSKRKPREIIRPNKRPLRAVFRAARRVRLGVSTLAPGSSAQRLPRQCPSPVLLPSRSSSPGPQARQYESRRDRGRRPRRCRSWRE